ncbi:fluoride efflux transporter CrcB [Gorillibacterium sp. sgz5001074]|uniref:fluoride efflux transporter CrcB n=1 Tax=Gorillibacterium sp. sgz5001074 TaxID=3446695 RepID=UPI003F66C795
MVYLIVGLAGICGALLRYGIGLGVAREGLSSIWATLPINLLGSFVLAGFLCYAESAGSRLHPWVKAGFGTGFLGAFTTFSTFSMETVRLLTAGQAGYAVLYVLASLWGGLAAAWLGWKAVSRSRLAGTKTVEGGGRA